MKDLAKVSVKFIININKCFIFISKNDIKLVDKFSFKIISSFLCD